MFASWVQSLEKAYKDNVEVLNLTCLTCRHHYWIGMFSRAFV